MYVRLTHVLVYMWAMCRLAELQDRRLAVQWYQVLWNELGCVYICTDIVKLLFPPSIKKKGRTPIHA